MVAEFSTGRSARYIADALMLSEHTIKSHLRRAYAKMDVHSRQELLSLVDQMEARIPARAADRRGRLVVHAASRQHGRGRLARGGGG